MLRRWSTHTVQTRMKIRGFVSGGWSTCANKEGRQRVSLAFSAFLLGGGGGGEGGGGLVNCDSHCGLISMRRIRKQFSVMPNTFYRSASGKILLYSPEKGIICGNVSSNKPHNHLLQFMQSAELSGKLLLSRELSKHCDPN